MGNDCEGTLGSDGGEGQDSWSRDPNSLANIFFLGTSTLITTSSLGTTGGSSNLPTKRQIHKDSPVQLKLDKHSEYIICELGIKIKY